MQNCDELPPRVEQTQSGNTVLYKGRYLYSKRQPQKQIETALDSLVSTERTLFIFASPALAYGAKRLIDILPSSSFLLFIEYDEQLGILFEQTFWQEFIAFNAAKNIEYLCIKDIEGAVQKVEIFTGFNFKRIEIVRGSAGFSLHEELYLAFFALLERHMSFFWKNRITLIEMARLYSRNIFKCLSYISKTETRFKALPQNIVTKPVMVVGAGPSLDSSLAFIKENRENFFLLAVDVALPTLSSIEVEADAVVLLEGQYWIEHAFLLSRYRKIPLFASITSNPHVFNILQDEVFLYSIEFAPINFLKNLRNTMPHLPSFAPLGSVGLLALQLALFITKKDVPIFHTGLDFSYSQGFSHARSSMHPQNITIANSRLKSLYSSSIFPTGLQKIKGKNEILLWSTTVLSSYATMYKSEFSHLNNIFDIGKSGLILRDRVLEEEEVKQLLTKQSSKCKVHKFECDEEKSFQMKKVQCFLNDEKRKLNAIKNMLTGGDEWNVETFINVIKSTDYLYLHFPDYSPSLDASMISSSFLKRIRIEVEYFLKIITEQIEMRH